MNFNDLTPEERELVIGKTPEQILALAKERGRVLSDEELEAISGGEMAGGRWNYRIGCMRCNTFWKVDSLEETWHTCPTCGNKFFC